MAGAHLGVSAHVAAIDRNLPQTQCTQCGYPSCLAYAQAIADSKSAINRCPPGGNATIERLAALVGQAPIPLDETCGSFVGPQRAFIVEEECIGCTLCIRACPVDAIIGAQKMIHTVMADECTGCQLCVDPCPVDCIKMQQAGLPIESEQSLWPDFSSRKVTRARERFHNRQKRLQQSIFPNRSRFDRRKIREEIMASVNRVQTRRSNKTSSSWE